MLTRKTYTLPESPRLSGGISDAIIVLRHLEQVKEAFLDILRDLNSPGTVSLAKADINSTPIGRDEPDSGKFTTLEATGNTTLGDATGDSVTVNGATFDLAAAATRIKSDFINATISNRAFFQDRGTNTNTSVGAIPSGTGSAANFAAYSGSDPANAHYIALQTSATKSFIDSSKFGTGTTRDMEFQIDGTTHAKLSTTGVLTAAANTATPAGGSTSARLLLGTTAGFGVYYGSGAPSVSAAKGSLYLRSDGTGTTDRAYINTDGGTTWTALTTGA